MSKEIFIKKWYSRNPAHENNLDTGEDMFWDTAFMVVKEYINEITPTEKELHHELTNEEQLGANYVIGTMLARMDGVDKPILND